jgi:hypothetical protein
VVKKKRAPGASRDARGLEGSRHASLGPSANHRRTQRAILAAGDGADSDCEFFRQHPERNYRLRLATPNEAVLANIDGAQYPGNCWWWSVAKQVAPGIHQQEIFLGPDPAPVCDDETFAALVFARYARAELTEILEKIAREGAQA